jgi:hypothetical protein
MTAADKKIIKENPNATPYELLSEHKLSQAAYDELVAASDAREASKTGGGEKLNKLVPNIVKKTTIAEPVLSPVHHTHHGNDTIMLRDKSTGSEFRLSKYAGERWLRKHPNRYELA